MGARDLAASVYAGPRHGVRGGGQDRSLRSRDALAPQPTPEKHFLSIPNGSSAEEGRTSQAGDSMPSSSAYVADSAYEPVSADFTQPHRHFVELGQEQAAVQPAPLPWSDSVFVDPVIACEDEAADGNGTDDHAVAHDSHLDSMDAHLHLLPNSEHYEQGFKGGTDIQQQMVPISGTDIQQQRCSEAADEFVVPAFESLESDAYSYSSNAMCLSGGLSSICEITEGFREIQSQDMRHHKPNPDRPEALLGLGGPLSQRAPQWSLGSLDGLHVSPLDCGIRRSFAPPVDSFLSSKEKYLAIRERFLAS